MVESNMVCALCRKPRVLQKSHVIPEFMYGALYDNKHRFHILSKDNEHRNSRAQKGLYEKLLCQPCERKLGNHERQVSIVFHGGIELEFEKYDDLIVVRGINYAAFRLFQLSILWRAGVSTLPFFAKVSLGPHAETLRLLLLNGDVGDISQYQCLMFGLIHEGAVQQDLIVQPVPGRVYNMLGYRFVFGGFVWFFFVASHRPTFLKNMYPLDPSGELRIVESQLSSAGFIREFAKELKKKASYEQQRYNSGSS